MIKEPIPLHIEAMANRLEIVGQHLVEDANICARNPVPERWDDLIVSARATFEALEAFFEEIRS